jgi:hypothetical protein
MHAHFIIWNNYIVDVGFDNSIIERKYIVFSL